MAPVLLFIYLSTPPPPAPTLERPRESRGRDPGCSPVDSRLEQCGTACQVRQRWATEDTAGLSLFLSLFKKVRRFRAAGEEEKKKKLKTTSVVSSTRPNFYRLSGRAHSLQFCHFFFSRRCFPHFKRPPQREALPCTRSAERGTSTALISRDSKCKRHMNMDGSEHRCVPHRGLHGRLREPSVRLFVAPAGLMLCQTQLQRRPLKMTHTQDIRQRRRRKNRALPRRVSTYMQNTSASGSLSVRHCVSRGVISSALHHCGAVIEIFLTFAFEISQSVAFFFCFFGWWLVGFPEARPPSRSAVAACGLACSRHGPRSLYWFPFGRLLTQKLIPASLMITTTDPCASLFPLVRSMNSNSLFFPLHTHVHELHVGLGSSGLV